MDCHSVTTISSSSSTGLNSTLCGVSGTNCSSPSHSVHCILLVFANHFQVFLHAVFPSSHLFLFPLLSSHFSSYILFISSPHAPAISTLFLAVFHLVLQLILSFVCLHSYLGPFLSAPVNISGFSSPLPPSYPPVSSSPLSPPFHTTLLAALSSCTIFLSSLLTPCHHTSLL